MKICKHCGKKKTDKEFPGPNPVCLPCRQAKGVPPSEEYSIEDAIFSVLGKDFNSIGKDSQQFYEASRIKEKSKRYRRTSEEIMLLKSRLFDIAKEFRPATVRQLFYQAVSRRLIEKTEASYDVIGRYLTGMRLDDCLPFNWIADNTRWQRKPRTYTSLENFLRQEAELYRRDVWDQQNVYVEVWLEKDALAGVLLPITAKWDVPLMVTRGYSSLSFLHTAAETIQEIGKPTYLYYLADYDPSGIDIPKNVERRLREFAPDSEIHFERIAVNPDQIQELNLQTRPTKKSDSRARNFVGESVEVDAIAP
ncbi:hypothetical protein L0152_03490, partial [bacterium]|nr:hypothetical protein [bacterium]